MNKSIPIWRDANALLLEVEQAVSYFSRYHKYTLGSEMRKTSMQVCRLINGAFTQKQNKVQKISQLVETIDDLKIRIQLAKELHVFRNFAQFERLTVFVVQVGKQSGWLRGV